MELEQFSEDFGISVEEILAAKIDPCAIPANLRTQAVEFEHGLSIAVYSDKDLPGLSLFNVRKGTYDDVDLRRGKAFLFVDRFTDYNLVGPDLCGNEVIWGEILQSDRITGAPADVTREAFDASIEWSKTRRSFYEYLKSNREISMFEKYFLVQKLLYQGRPFPEKAFPNDYEYADMPPDVERNGRTPLDVCRCATLRIRSNYDLSPRGGTFGHNQYISLYGNNEDTHQSGDTKVWNAYSRVGPSRYEQLWGISTPGSCRRPPQRYDINGSLNTNDSGLPDINRIAYIDHNFVCTDQFNFPDGTCGCERPVHFQFQYNSVVRAQAETNPSGTPLFCSSTRGARARAYDFMEVAVNNLHEVDQSSFRILAAQFNGQERGCGQSWAGPTVADILRLGYYAYAYSSGAPATGIPVLDAATSALWDNYYSNLALDQLDDIFSGPWREFIGNCGGSATGRSRTLSPFEQNYTHMMRVFEPFRVAMMAGDQLEVGGQRRWSANARLHSSFSMASVIQGGTNNDYGDYCCAPYSGNYMLSTASEDVGEASISSWRNSITQFWNNRDLNASANHVNFGHVVMPAPSGCDIEIIQGRSVGTSTEVSILFENAFGQRINWDSDYPITNVQLTDGIGRALPLRSQSIMTEVDDKVYRMRGLSSYPADIYYLVLSDEYGHQQVEKIIHQP